MRSVIALMSEDRTRQHFHGSVGVVIILDSGRRQGGLPAVAGTPPYRHGCDADLLVSRVLPTPKCAEMKKQMRWCDRPCRCLELVELLAMFAPGDVPEALPEVMPFVQASRGTLDRCMHRSWDTYAERRCVFPGP